LRRTKRKLGNGRLSRALRVFEGSGRGCGF
jgi:hypothetical protein